MELIIKQYSKVIKKVDKNWNLKDCQFGIVSQRGLKSADKHVGASYQLSATRSSATEHEVGPQCRRNCRTSRQLSVAVTESAARGT